MGSGGQEKRAEPQALRSQKVGANIGVRGWAGRAGGSPARISGVLGSSPSPGAPSGTGAAALRSSQRFRK